MQREEENGASPITDFLDKMAQAALDDGCDGVEQNRCISFGKMGRDEVF